MAVTEFNAALRQVATERGIPEDSILETIRTAIASAYRRDYGSDLPAQSDEEEEVVVVELDSDTGETKIFDSEGKDVTPRGFGRIAAQTAKQVILQKIRETEKEIVLEEFKGKIGEIITGTIFRAEESVVVLDLGKAQGILPRSEQVELDEYKSGQRLKVLIKDIRESTRGTEIIVSRSDPHFVTKLFEQEVPEIASEVVIIEAISREAGSRTKMAVSSNDDKIDPVGSCVGQKGVRVQAIITEIRGEKIDIITFSDNIDKFIAASLSPAKVTGVEINEEDKDAKVSVPEDQLSLAIGKDGQNVRLAAKLTKWRIDIKGADGLFDEDGKLMDSVVGGKEVVGVWDAAIKASKKIEQEEKDDKESKNIEEKEKEKEKEEESVDEKEVVEESEKVEENKVDEPAEKIESTEEKSSEGDGTKVDDKEEKGDNKDEAAEKAEPAE